MTLFKDIAERQLTRFIENELPDIQKYPEDVVQGTYLETIEHIEENNLDLSLVALGALFMQGLESEWQETLSANTREPLVSLDMAHKVYPQTYYELAPANDYGVYAILCDLDTGNIIGPMTKDLTAEHTARLMSKHNG